MSKNVTTKVDAVVIGAGVLGLAVARALSIGSTSPASSSRRRPRRPRKRREVLLIEKHSAIGMETSSRNSQVIHAGLYYPHSSNKARWCVEGRQLLYEYCHERSIFVNRCGKLVVATALDQVNNLRTLHRQALKNGVDDVEMIDSVERVQDMEPQLVTTIAALYSPSTGIVDAHDLMQHLLVDAERDGSTTLVLNTNIKEARISCEGRVQLRVPMETKNDSDEGNPPSDDDEMWLDCNVVVNAAGLWADEVARMIHKGSEMKEEKASPDWHPPRQYFCKGTYFRLDGGHRSPFSHLVYPIPDPSGGLGVHATLDEGGQVKFGPDVEWLPIEDPNTGAADRLSYVPDPNRAQSFHDSIRQYWPDLPSDSLVPDYCGIRPKLSHPCLEGVRNPSQFHDFGVAGPKEHGVKGLVHLLGMESPGLTSSLAVAEHVADLLEDA